MAGQANLGRCDVGYATLMVNMELGVSNAGLLRVSNALATRFDANVIGIAARQPMQTLYNDGCYVSPEIIDEDREESRKELDAAEAEFRDLVERPATRLEWRSTLCIEPPSDYVACEARHADLVLTGVPPRRHADSTHVAAGELIMQVGRPVLVVPSASHGLALDHIVLAWKDTREARRAAADALPLLQGATRVTIVEIATSDEIEQASIRLKDAATWLLSHSITADVVAWPSSEDDSAQLNALAEERGADLIVAGAYGHSRLREWALGGITRDLLRSTRCTMLSH